MTYQEWREDCEFNWPIYYGRLLKWTIKIDAVDSFQTPHFNLYDCHFGGEPTKVATLSILTDEIFYRGEDWLDQWILTKREIWLLRWLLRMGRGIESYYSYWGIICDQWNDILYAQDKIEYYVSGVSGLNRETDKAHKNDPLYIPSTQPIPHWHY